jgi:tyrosine-protein kinase Etk/Wzc
MKEQPYDQFSEIEESQSGFGLETLLRDYLPYWPVALVFAIFGVFVSKIYLRTLIPTYEVSANVLVKDEGMTSNNLLLTAATGKSQTYLEDQKEVMKGMPVMERAVKKTNFQWRFRHEGRLGTRFVPLDESPFSCYLFNSDSFVTIQDHFALNESMNAFRIGDSVFAMNQRVSFGGNVFLLSIKDREKAQAYIRKKGANGIYVEMFSLDKAAKSIRESFEAELSKSTSVITLKVENHSVDYGKQILSSIIESYKEETQAEKRKKAEFTVAFIEERLAYIGDDLDSIERQIEQFKKNNGLQQLTAEATRYLERIKSGDELNSQTELQLFVLNDLENYVKGRINKPGMVPSSIGLNDPSLAKFTDKLYDAEQKLEVLTQTSGPDNDNVVILKKEVAGYKKSLLEIIQNIRSNLNTIKKKSDFDAKSIENQYQSVLSKIPEKERKLLEITRQQEVKNALYTFLLQKREESAIEMAGTLSEVRIINQPDSSGIPVSPKSAQILAIGAILGLGIVVMVLFFKSSTNNKVSSAQEIELRTQIPVIAQIVFDENNQSPLIMKEGNRTLIAEQFRALRTNLTFLDDTSVSSNALLVTSSFPGEGKSFVATNIAMSFALTGKKTIIIESDLRKPNVAKHFQLNRRNGLSVYLNGSAPLEEVVFDIEGVANLFVIPAGPIPPNPVELILNGRYKTLIETLRKEYDHIIIDCPPIGLVTDAFEIGSFVDYAIFVTRHGYTPREAVSNILERSFRDKKFKQSAIVFNGIKGGISGYGYGYNYGYGGYGYGYGYGYGSGYGYGYGQSYGYGYYGSEKRKRNRLGSLLWNVFIAPFGAFFGIRKK